MVTVAVGSMNPVKIDAVREGFSHYFNRIDIIPVNIYSCVPKQPFNNDVIKGAENRAKGAIKKADSDFGVGIEGGIIELFNRYYNLGVCVIIDKKGKIGTGTTNLFECPKGFVSKLKNGKELGNVIDEVTGEKDTKRKYGAIGFLSKNVIERKMLYKYGVIMALLPFINGVYNER
ncbi:MAG: inosine/xanthosine triphosphatase [Candidatus Aenigmatarchaeota archaeon]